MRSFKSCSLLKNNSIRRSDASDSDFNFDFENVDLMTFLLLLLLSVLDCIILDFGILLLLDNMVRDRADAMKDDE